MKWDITFGEMSFKPEFWIFFICILIEVLKHEPVKCFYFNTCLDDCDSLSCFKGKETQLEFPWNRDPEEKIFKIKAIVQRLYTG
jgi:hypothetical protein